MWPKYPRFLAVVSSSDITAIANPTETRFEGLCVVYYGFPRPSRSDALVSH